MLGDARVAVVVPAHDEEARIGRVLDAMPSWVDHVVVVDDASRDGTAARVEACADTRVELVRHAFNRGVGAAIVSGYRRAFEAGADVAAVMAGDAQMDVRDLEAVVSPVARGEVDYVKGDRLSHPHVRARMPVARWVGNQALTGMTRLATGLTVTDTQCGYTALGREAARRLDLDALWPRYGYPNDLLSRAAVAGLRIGEVVVQPVYADERSGIRLSDLLLTFPPVLARAAGRRLRAALGRGGRGSSAAAPSLGDTMLDRRGRDEVDRQGRRPLEPSVGRPAPAWPAADPAE